MKPRLQVMKFGGTSVGDASCIARTAQIIAKAGNAGEAAAIIDALRQQHGAALTSLVRREEERTRIRQQMDEVLAEGLRLCEGTALLRELTPRTLDAISSLGERLSAPLV